MIMRRSSGGRSKNRKDLLMFELKGARPLARVEDLEAKEVGIVAIVILLDLTMKKKLVRTSRGDPGLI